MLRKLREEWQRLVTSRLALNAGWWSLGQALSIGCQAGYFIFISRLLGNKEYGIYVGAVAMSSVLSRAATLGTPFVLLRYVSCDSRAFAAYWGNVLATCIASGSICILFLSLAGPYFAHSYSWQLLFFVALGDCVLSPLKDALAVVFQAFEQMRMAAAMSSLTSVLRLSVACGLFFFRGRDTAVEWAAASLIVSLLVTVLGFVIITPRYGWPIFSWRLWRSRAGEGALFALSGSTTAVYNDIDKALLGHFGMNIANGIYTIAYRIVDMCTIPIISVQSVALPRLFRDGLDGACGSAALSARILKRSAPLALLCSVAMLVAAPLIPRILGAGFAESVPALRWLCILPLFRSFQLTAGDAVTACGRQSARFVAQATAAVFNFGVNLYLIPRYSWLGAAWSSLATDAMLAGLNWAILLWLIAEDRRHKNRDIHIRRFPESSALPETANVK